MDIPKVLADHYALQVKTLTFIQAENDAIWKVESDDNTTHLLRVRTGTNHDSSDVTARADFLAAQSTTTQPLPKIIPARNGQLTVHAGNQHIIELSDWITGHNITHWTPDTATQAGRALANFANTSRNYDHRSSHAQNPWRCYRFESICARAHKTLPPQWQSILAALQETITPTITQHLTQNHVIHGDIHRENFIQDTNKTTVHLIDFADLGIGPPAYDAITAFSSLARLGDDTITAAFCQSYQGHTEQPLPSIEVLTVLLTLRDIAIATHLTHQNVEEDWVPARLTTLSKNCPNHAGETHKDLESLRAALD